MTSPPSDSVTRRLHWGIAGVLILSSLGLTVGRLLAVRSRDQHTPMLSANDRSRWCAVRALVDEHTAAIDRVIADRHPQTNRTPWRTIDMVRHRGSDGREHYYSSKPPLLSTLVAGEYWLLKHVAGWEIRDQPFLVIQCILIVTNVVPLAAYLVGLAVLVERAGTTRWGRLYVIAASAFGTFLTTFAVTFNNHLPAAICTLVTVYVALPLWNEGNQSAWRFATAGLFAAQAAAYELPALSFAGLIGAGLLWRSPGRTLAYFAPPAALVAGAFFLTTYLAHGTWRTPYAHRKDGPILATLVSPAPADGTHPVSAALHAALAAAGIRVSQEATTATREKPQSWVLWDEESQQRFALAKVADTLEVREWDNWYEYEGTYWSNAGKQGVDKGEPSRLVYAFHVLIGHHGVFSLSPIWLLSCIGVAKLCRQAWRSPRSPPETVANESSASLKPATTCHYDSLAILGPSTLVLTLVCLAFYLTRPLEDRNYGGVAAGFRWCFWLTPLWLLCLLPAADSLAARRSGWIVGVGFLALGVLSACYAFLNPWSHPWIYDLWMAR